MKEQPFKMLLLATVCIVMFSACWGFYPDDPAIEYPEGEQEGYQPIYAQESDLEVKLTEPREILLPGKIYTKNDFLFLIEPNIGIHIMDNSNLETPEKIGFLEVMGVTDMAIRNNVLYVNQYSDLVAVDISDINDVKTKSREHDVLAVNGGLMYPPQYGHFYECPDRTKGIVIGWKFTTIDSPQCF